MSQIRVICMVLFAWIAGLVWPNPAISADVFDFAVIQPGQPGTSEEAQPVMDALAAYIRKKMRTEVTIKGTYFNKLDSALDFLHNRRPAWGIVRLGFYSEQADVFPMTSLASTRPGGCKKDMWRLVVSKEGPGDWKSLKGRILGNMLFERDAASCLLFGVPSDRLPFTLEGTFHPLRSLRSVSKGKAAGVVLDRSQHEAVRALPLVNEIRVIHTSRELPTSPVVWFGKPDKRAQDLTAILLKMKEDGDAQTLLKLLQTDGFGPPDPDLPQLIRGKGGAVCFP
jgi:hypothetical protein